MPWPPLDCTWYYWENRHLASTAQQFTLNTSRQNKHWQELTQVSFLLWQNFCCSQHVFVMTNACLSQQNTSFVMTKVCLLGQNFCRAKIMFVATTYFCCDKTFVTTNICHDKHVLSQPAYFCHDKRRVLLSQPRQTCFCHDKHICCDKTCVATKLLVAAPTSDTKQAVHWPRSTWRWSNHNLASRTRGSANQILSASNAKTKLDFRKEFGNCYCDTQESGGGSFLAMNTTEQCDYTIV